MSGYNSETVRDRHAVIHIYINRKPCMESPMTPSDLTLGDLERESAKAHGSLVKTFLLRQALAYPEGSLLLFT